MNNIPTVGMVLVASHILEGDECFRRSVILLASSAGDGWVGLNIAGPVTEEGWVRNGGPLDAPLLLLTKVNDVTKPLAVGESGYAVVCLDETKTIAEMKPVVEPILARHEKTSMAISGYAGWGPDQLGREIEFGYWRLAALSLDELLAVPSEERWELANKLLDAIQPNSGDK